MDYFQLKDYKSETERPVIYIRKSSSPTTHYANMMKNHQWSIKGPTNDNPVRNVEAATFHNAGWWWAKNIFQPLIIIKMDSLL